MSYKKIVTVYPYQCDYIAYLFFNSLYQQYILTTQFNYQTMKPAA